MPVLKLMPSFINACLPFLTLKKRKRKEKRKRRKEKLGFVTVTRLSFESWRVQIGEMRKGERTP